METIAQTVPHASTYRHPPTHVHVYPGLQADSARPTSTTAIPSLVTSLERVLMGSTTSTASVDTNSRGSVVRST